MPRFRLLPDSRLVRVAELYTDQERKTSPAFNEAMPLGETQNGLNVRLDGPDGSHIGWQLADPVDGDGWSMARTETIERLLPHIRQFVRVRQSLVSARALASTVIGLLENTRFGVIQLDRRGRIVDASDRARDILSKSDGLSDRDGLLCASTPADDAALQKALNRALPRFGGQGASGTMMVKRSVVSPGLVLHVIPMSDERTDMRPRGVAALVLVVNPASRARIDPALVGALLGLTPAESHVAVMLAQGYTIRQIAIETGRSEGTIRWHIKPLVSH